MRLLALLAIVASLSGCQILASSAVSIGFQVLVGAIKIDTAVIENEHAREAYPEAVPQREPK